MPGPYDQRREDPEGWNRSGAFIAALACVGGLVDGSSAGLTVSLVGAIAAAVLWTRIIRAQG